MASLCEDVISLTCNDGIKLGGRRFYHSSGGEDGGSSSSPSRKILCWHGWLDNCRSFYHLGPAIVDNFEDKKEDVEVYCLDFPGHGTSSHKSLDGPGVVLMEYCYYLHEAIRQLNWDPADVTLIGHSMGAAVSLMYSAAFPVQNLILLDSLGPHPKPAKDVAKSLRQHITARSKGKAPQSIYPNVEKAIETRCLTAKAFPGNQYISKEAAKELVEGATKTLDAGRLEFQHDQRLKWTSIVFLAKEHVVQIYSDVGSSSTKTCVLLGADGMPFDEKSLAICQNTLKPTVMKTLPGSHHFHMDPDSADDVAKEVIEFLQQSR